MPKGKPNLKNKLDTQLMKISNEQMHHFSKYRREGNSVANKIFGILTSNSKTESIAISRCVIGGSIGKRSSLGAAFAPDFDLVVFINNEHPPFKEVLLKFEKILQEFCPRHGFIFKSDGKPTRHSLQFQIQIAGSVNAFGSPRCISFDLLPASNLLPPRHGGMILTKGVREQTQTEFALIRIAQLEDPDHDSSMYSSSLVDRSVSFAKRQGPFVHNMIRLCKLWNKQVVDYSGYMYGRSTMVELVAIFAGNKEEAEAKAKYDGSRPSISSAFRKFLHLFEDIETNMCVYFPFQINSNQAKLLEVYEEKIAHRPVVLDPVNPYNNLVARLSKEAMDAFQIAAKNSLDTLDENKGTGLTKPELLLPGLSSLKIQ